MVLIDAAHLGSSSGSSVTLPELPACNAYDSDDDTYCHCPFKYFEEYPDGVGGRGYVRKSIIKHIHDRHYPSSKHISICRDRIRIEVSVYTAWERVLR